jgi:hypothetical protein
MHRGTIPVLPALCLRGWKIVIIRPFRQQQIALPLTGKPRSSEDSGCRADSVGHGSCRGHPARLRHDGGFAPVSPPVTRHYLNREGVSDKFVAYIKSLWLDCVAEESAHS